MNKINETMKKIAERYCSKNNLEIEAIKYGEFYLQAILKNNDKGIQQLNFNLTMATRGKLENQIYMKSESNGKQKRISKKEW